MMQRNIAISVQMRKVKEPNGTETLKATVPMNIMFEKEFDAEWFEEELTKFENEYLMLVEDLKNLWQLIKSEKQRKRKIWVLFYWKIGDRIIEFSERNKNNPLFLESLTKYLVRDVGVSDKTVMRCKRFRLLYPDVTKIDQDKSFDSYVASFEGGYISRKRLERKK